MFKKLNLSIILVLLLICCKVFSYSLISDIFVPENVTDVLFGYSVDSDGVWAIISSPKEDSTVEGDQKGAAFIYKKNELNVWEEHQKIVGSDESTRLFGNSVAISNNFVIIGASQTSNWKGKAFIFKLQENENSWKEVANLTYSDIKGDDAFGHSVALSEYNGNFYAVVGASGINDFEGGVFVYQKRNDSIWDQIAFLEPSDGESYWMFGCSVAISGSSILIGAGGANNGQGCFYFYKLSGENVILQGSAITSNDIEYGDEFADKLQISGNIAIVSATGKDSSTGVAYIFELDEETSTWIQQVKLHADSDSTIDSRFGSAVSISSSVAIVGSYYANEKEGKLYVFEKDGTSWSTVSVGSAIVINGYSSESRFGFSASIDKFGYIFVGAQATTSMYSAHFCSFSCKNNGLPDGECSTCTCPNYWSSSSCATCGLSCMNGGTIDEDCSFCECKNLWAGLNCSNCSLICNGNTTTNSDCIECECENKAYEGEFCTIWKCANYPTSTDYEWEFDENRNGCIKNCNSEFVAFGDYCILEKTLVYGIAIVGVVGTACLSAFFCIIFSSFLIIFILCKKANKFNHIENVEMILKEAELEQKQTKGETPLDTIKIKNFNLIIDPKEIELEKIIGQGASGVVYIANWKGQKCAYKGFKLNNVFNGNSPESSFEEFKREITVCKEINHPSILQFFGACVQIPKIGIVLEYAEFGDLFSFLNQYQQKKHSPYPKDQKLRILTEIASGMEYLHSRKFIHRDLKPDNVLVNDQEHSKISDFGLTKLKKDNNNKTMTSYIGTAHFMAPEVIKGGKYSFECDVYSFSMLAYAFVTENRNIFGETTTAKVLRNIEVDPSYRPEIEPKDFESFEFLIPLIQKNWNFEPKQRNTFAEIREILQKKKDCV